MASIYDHRPTTRGAGPGMSPWVGAGLGAAHAQDLKRQAEQDEREADEAARREEEYQGRKRVRDLQITEAERMAAEGAATRRAARESIGIRYDQIADRLSAKQRAGLERWIADPSVDDDFVKRQLDEWGAEQDLEDLLEDATELKGYAQSVGTDHETGEPGALAEGAQAILDRVKAKELTVGQGKLELKEMERSAILEKTAREQQAAADQQATQMIAEMGSLDPMSENYDRVVDLIADIRSSVVTAPHPDKSKGMMPKDYRTMLTRLEYYLRPELADAAKADMEERAQSQAGLEAADPVVYGALKQLGGEVRPEVFMAAKEAYDLSGMPGLRRAAGLPPAADPARADDLRATGTDQYDMSGFDIMTPPTSGQDEFARKPKKAGQTLQMKPRKLKDLPPEEVSTSLRNLRVWVRGIDVSGMSAADLKKTVEEHAREIGIDATFSELMEAMPAAGEEIKPQSGAMFTEGAAAGLQ